MMFKVLLVRLGHYADRTISALYVYQGQGTRFAGVALEPPWLNNEPNKSCIPVGDYTVIPRHSAKHGDHLLIEGVPGRDLCLFHTGNFPEDTEGCVLPGLKLSDIDQDGKMEPAASGVAMRFLTQIIKERALLKVIDL